MASDERKNDTARQERYDVNLTDTQLKIVINMLNYADAWKSTPARNGRTWDQLLRSYKNVELEFLPGDGWLTHNIIEHQGVDYTWSKRSLHLTNELNKKKKLVEASCFEYKNKNNLIAGKMVYRLRKGDKAFKRLFYSLRSKGKLNEFLKSDYFMDAKIPVTLKELYFAKGRDFQKLKEEDYALYCEVVEESFALAYAQRKLYIVPPSLIIAYLDGYDLQAAVNEFGINTILKSCFVYDLVICKDIKCQKLYMEALKKLNEMEVNSKK
ncbi:MAG: hypothetical protein V1837_06830 [Candidatus Woesearchaeota archaeon]